mgnify:CR=1 FL=1
MELLGYDGEALQTWGVTTNRSGRFTLDGLPTGQYGLSVKGMTTLRARGGVDLAPGMNVVNIGTLYEGDVDNDGDIDGVDASLINLAFGSTPGDASWDPRADLNDDGLVGAEDMSLLAANFGLGGSVFGPEPAAAAAAEIGRAHV